MDLTRVSIKNRLFVSLFIFISFLLIIRGVLMFYEIKDGIFGSVKQSLHLKIQILKGLLYEKDGEIRLERNETISGEYTIPRSGYYYKVVTDGKALASSGSLVEDDFALAAVMPEYSDKDLKESVYFSVGPANERIMVLQHDFMLFGRTATIYAAQSLEGSLALIDRIRNFFLISVFITIFIAVFAALWIARYSLKPLKMFSSKIEKITHRTLGERIDSESQGPEMKGLARSFNDMLDRLRHAFEAEKRFIADASHELKTPLAVINTKCEVLLQKERSKEEYAKALTVINNTSKKIRSIIDDMISLARLDSGILSAADFREITVKTCIEDAVRLVETLAEKNNVGISAGFAGMNDVKVHGDENSLTEAFLNIIENAVRYNVPGGKVEISAHGGSDKVLIVVKDTGTGIGQADIKKIFGRFYRADASRNTEGSGLGLSIAKTIIDAHNGEIKAESEIGRGSSFTIIIPAIKRQTPSLLP